MAGYCIYQENSDKMERIRDIAAAFVEYHNYGGTVGGFTDKIINEVFDLAKDVKMNSDFCNGSIDYKAFQDFQQQKQATLH